MRNAYNGRIVNYEQVHGLTEADFTALLEALNLTPRASVLEGCVGYGAVARRILSAYPEIELACYDNSEFQLGRLRIEVPALAAKTQTMDMRTLVYASNSFDRYTIKAGLQELPFAEQSLAFQEAYRVLNPGGSFIIWQPTPSRRVRKTFTEVVRKKDELAGFESMAQNRYWNTLEEWTTLFQNAGFNLIEVCHKADFRFHAQNRANELVSQERLANRPEGELQSLAQERVRSLVSYVKSRIPTSLYEELEYQDRDNDFALRIPNLIIRGQKLT